MPNHVANVVKMEGISKLPLFTTEYDEYEKRNITRFDFNKLIPMPESLNIESGSRTDIAIIYYATERCTLPVRGIKEENMNPVRAGLGFSLGDKSWAEEVFWRALEQTHGMSEEEKNKLYEDGSTYVSNYQNYGSTTWYDWCIKHWGTKRNAYQCEIEDDKITFWTAWSNPQPIIEKLAEMYPDAHIEHTWADEDMGHNSGYREYIDGSWYEDYDESESVAFEHYVECWGESECLYKDEDGNWQRYHCDTCHKCD